MEQITIRIKDKKKAQMLIEFLKSLDFIETVGEEEMSGHGDWTPPGGEMDFFAMAGLWAGRDISLKTIREQAWPYHS